MGDRRRNNFIDYPMVRKSLIESIYRMIAVSKYKYRLIRSDDDLEGLKKRVHFVGPSYSGMNCLMVFLSHEDRYYSFTVNRSTLSFRREQVDFEQVQLFPFELRVDHEVYRGTILDGVYLRGEKPKFIVNDVYYLSGRSVEREQMKHKMIHMKMFLEGMVADRNFSKMTVELNKFDSLDRIEEVHSEAVKNPQVNGLAFVPEYSGMKMVYLLEDRRKSRSVEQRDRPPRSEKPRNDKPRNDKPEKKPKKPVERRTDFRVVEKAVEIEAVFEIRTTETKHVYDLYLFGRDRETKKPALLKFADAYLPTTEASHLCADLLGEKERALVTCAFQVENQKWVPVSGKTAKAHPDTVKKVSKLIS